MEKRSLIKRIIIFYDCASLEKKKFVRNSIEKYAIHKSFSILKARKNIKVWIIIIVRFYAKRFYPVWYNLFQKLCELSSPLYHRKHFTMKLHIPNRTFQKEKKERKRERESRKLRFANFNSSSSNRRKHFYTIRCRDYPRSRRKNRVNSTSPPHAHP